MKTLRKNLPNEPILTDGGLETELIFDFGVNLPHFAAFHIIDKPQYQKLLKDYYKRYLNVARKNKTGFILESPTWRASSDWGYKLGYSDEDLAKMNQFAIQQFRKLKKEYIEDIDTILISGQLGPRGDGYQINGQMTADEACQYHKDQIRTFKNEGVDLVSALTITYKDEALGVVKAAQEIDIPVVISFTLETDGCLPSGEKLGETINAIDKETDEYPIYYMINCAHPTHFVDQLRNNEIWKNRIHGLRTNASCKSHAELDESTELDSGDREELGAWHKTLKELLPNLTVFGGCCGTDVSHIESICEHVLEA
jgi:S-methylmethionine-dependent homocysteine/selenocysteine methylase